MESILEYMQKYDFENLFFCQDKALDFKGVVGISIATRPDCLGADVLELFAELGEKTDLWIEVGLQSSHDKTLDFLQRGHSFQDYCRGIASLKALPLRICTHIMLGLPGEGAGEICQTAGRIGETNTHEVKIHPLLVLKDTPLAEMHARGELRTLELEEYISQACDFLERLPAEMVIQRVTAEAPGEMLLAPRWALNKLKVINGIEMELKRRGSRQGIHARATPSP